MQQKLPSPPSSPAHLPHRRIVLNVQSLAHLGIIQVAGGACSVNARGVQPHLLGILQVEQILGEK